MIWPLTYGLASLFVLAISLFNPSVPARICAILLTTSWAVGYAIQTGMDPAATFYSNILLDSVIATIGILLYFCYRRSWLIFFTLAVFGQLAVHFALQCYNNAVSFPSWYNFGINSMFVAQLISVTWGCAHRILDPNDITHHLKEHEEWERHTKS